MKHSDPLLFSESPFLDECELFEEAPRVAPKPLDGLLSETPFLSLEIERFEAEEEFLQMESQETRYDGGPPKKEYPVEMEEPETSIEEYNGKSTASITADFSLKGLADGTLGNIPEAIRSDLLSGRERDLWTLTNRVFWDKHQGLRDTPLNPKDPKQKALVAEYGRMTRDVRALLWLTQLVELLDKYRGDLPRDFLLGWMAKESDGRVGVTTRLGERGYFQIHPAEFREILKLKDKDFPRVSTDREFSIKQGIGLVQAHRSNITANYSVADPSELLWKLTKARHGLPGLLKATLDGIKKSGAAIEWDAVAAKMRTAGDRGVSSNVEKTMEYASSLKALTDKIPEPAATTPELYEEAELLDEETGVIDGEDRKQVKDTFQQPYQWICRIALRKNGKDVDFGTGFLISDRHVLTAAHVVEKAFKQPAEYDIGVRIAMNWDTDLAEYSPRKPRLPSRYKPEVTRSTLDYALLTLSDSPGGKKFSKLKGKTLGHFARANVAAADVQGATGHTAGFPTEKDRLARKMFAASGRLTFPGNRPLDAAPFLQYSGDTTKGQSGSPVWLSGEDGIQLVGMAIVASQTSNTVLRLNAAVWTQLDAWMGEQESEHEHDEEGLHDHDDEFLHEHDDEDLNDPDLEASDPELELEAEAVAPDTIEEEEPWGVREADAPEIAEEAPAMAAAVTTRPGAGAAADPCAERRSINEAQTLKEPFARPCCALHPTLPMDQSLRVEDASPHFYGENKYPVDEKSGFVYTCHAGFVDLGHSRDWLDWTGYLAVHAKALLPGGGDLELTCEGDSTRTVQFKSQGEKRSDELCVYLAQRIAYQLAIWHEIVTALFGHRYTAFSPEDNYSNLLGTYMGRDALLTFRKKPFNEAASLAIKQWLKKLGAVSQSQTRAAFASVKDVWWKDVGFTSLNDLLLKRHFDALGPVTPMLAPGMCSGSKPLPLPVPAIVQTPRSPGVMVKTDLRKLYVLKLGIGSGTATKLAGTAWAGKVHVTPDDFSGLIGHVKTIL